VQLTFYHKHDKETKTKIIKKGSSKERHFSKF